MLISPYSAKNYLEKLFLSILILIFLFVGLDRNAFSQISTKELPSFFDTKSKSLQDTKSDIPDINELDINKIELIITNLNKFINNSNKNLNLDVSKLKFIKLLYLHLESLIKKQNTLKFELKQIKNRLDDINSIKPNQKPPYNLSFYDNLLDQISSINQEIETQRLDIKLVKNLLNQTSNTTNNIEINFNQLNNRDLDTIIQNLNTKILEIRLENLKLNLKILELNKEILNYQANWVKKHLYFDKNDLNKQLQAIEKKKREIKKKIDSLLIKQKQEEKLWRSIIEKSRFVKNKSTIATEIKAQQAWLKTIQLMLQEYEEILKLLDKQRDIWIQRYQLLNQNLPIKKLLKLKHKIKDTINELTEILNLQQNYQITLQSQLALLDNQLQTPNLNYKLKQALISLEQALRERAQTRIEYIIYLFKTIALEQRLLNQIDYKLSQTSVEKTLLTITTTISKLLDFSIWTIDNSPVTLKKLIVAIIVLILGILASRYSVKKLRIHLINSTQLEDTTISAIEKITFYILITLVALLALKIVHIPLEAFAFLGGALAIGIGFGAQNLINNFISGFIMMAERPISIGDIIEIEGKAGIVEEIGARCTRIRTIGNIHILVPNSSFLEKNITNWTLSDRRIRISINVGVAYGSPVKKVEKLLIDAVEQCENTLKKPDPLVIFKDFGDNALIFKLYFWISLKKILEREIIASEVRFKIDELFRKENIVIAFPQRDVHLDSISPITIKIDKN